MRLSQNDSMLSEGTDQPLPPRCHSVLSRKLSNEMDDFQSKKQQFVRQSSREAQTHSCSDTACHRAGAVLQDGRTYRAGARLRTQRRPPSFLPPQAEGRKRRRADKSRWRSSAEQGPQKGPLFEDCLSTARYARPSVGIERPSLTPCSEAPQKRRSQSKG